MSAVEAKRTLLHWMHFDLGGVISAHKAFLRTEIVFSFTGARVALYVNVVMLDCNSLTTKANFSLG